MRVLLCLRVRGVNNVLNFILYYRLSEMNSFTLIVLLYGIPLIVGVDPLSMGILLNKEEQ